MKYKSYVVEFILAFLVCTACITILEGVMGMLFFPEEKLGYDAFFSPPIFGFFSVLFGLVTYSGKELSVRQVLLRRGLHLLLVEGMVLGLNNISGRTFQPLEFWTLVVFIALVFVAVYAVMWVNDLRSAALFNEKLKAYQQDAQEKGFN